MRLWKKIVLCLLCIIPTIALASCNSLGGNTPDDDPNINQGGTKPDVPSVDLDEKRQAIYKLAVASGFTGTYEEWLASIQGDQIELSISETHIVWKYIEDKEWKNLISLDSIQGIQGDKGEAGLSAYQIYLKYHPEYTGSESEWMSDLVNGALVERQYSVVFKDGEEVISTIKIDPNDCVTAPNDPIKSGYSFDGWYYNDVLWDFTKAVEGNMILTAKWVSISQDTTGLDININYNGISGITYRSTTSFYNDIENKTYTLGDLLPTWQAFSNNLGVKFYDASGYTTSRDNDTYHEVKNKKYVSETNEKRKIDLFYNTSTNINSMGTEGEAVDLVPYLDKMPNFKAFLNANPTIRKSIERSGSIYYTPYFDGYNDVERMFIMDTQIAKKVLDASSFDTFDTTQNGGVNPAANVVQKASYTPFMDAVYNLRASEFDSNNQATITVLDNVSEVKTIKINRVENIIVQQNRLLTQGCTGKELAEQFRTYLSSVYGDDIGIGKIFESYSDIFVSESAAYNTDELIALLRVVKANPGVITGNSSDEVEIFFPRGQASNRVDNIADMLQLWGIQGMTSEKDMLYFAADGTLRDAATTDATYEGLKYLAQIYSEGLILTSFWDKPASTSGIAYLDKYFKKTTTDAGYGFMMYDYCVSTTATNDIVDGIGTEASNRKISYSSKGIMPVLPPLTYWADEYDVASGFKTNLLRYSEDNRSLKNNSWCIPSTSDNIDDAIKLMDYMYSEKGSRIQDFGPEAYWEEKLQVIAGEESPVLNATAKKMLAESGKDFWSFMRGYIGSTHGIGYKRSKALDIQSTNAYGQIGSNNLKNAIHAGIVTLGMVDKSTGYTWDTTVPTNVYPVLSGLDTDRYASITAFWALDKNSDKPLGWVYYIKNYDHLFKGVDMFTTDYGLGYTNASMEYTFKHIKEEMSIKDSTYLYAYALALGEELIPDYLK